MQNANYVTEDLKRIVNEFKSMITIEEKNAVQTF